MMVKKEWEKSLDIYEKRTLKRLKKMKKSRLVEEIMDLMFEGWRSR